ncbi:MAG: hypothetical protein L6R40_003327 [Gallowayella cf. fulva]|nr:MAG: hypothetical protein L6R40_003327 [Xanthomendoza cf. fulva]
MAQTPRTVLKVGDLLNSKEDMRLMDSSKHVADHEPAKIATTNPNPGMEINSNAAASTHHHGLYGSAQPQVLNRNEAVVDPNTNQQKGLTRYASSPRLEYLHHGVWKPAIYHTELREMILRIFDHFGRYDEEPSKGLDPWDRTSLHKRQQSWVFRDREKRPEVLFLWEPSDQPPDYVPGLWHHENKMVLDTDDRPIQLWKELPMTISGQCEGVSNSMMRPNPFATTRPKFRKSPGLFLL